MVCVDKKVLDRFYVHMTNSLLKLDPNFIVIRNENYEKDKMVYLLYAMYITCVPRNVHIEDLKVKESTQLKFESTNWCKEFEENSDLKALIDSFE